MVKVGIVGGTGYTGVELLRLLAQHPQVEVVVITSRSEAGLAVADMYPNLRGHYDGLAFSVPDTKTLADIASHPPRQQADLAKVRGLSPGWKENEIGKRLMAALAGSSPLTEDELPPRTQRGAPLGKEGALVADLLKMLLKIRAREIDVAARLLARSDDLELLAAGVRKNLSLLDGWRYEVFGRDALELVEGKLAFAVLGGKLKMTHVDEIHGDMAQQNPLAAEDEAIEEAVAEEAVAEDRA